MDVRDKRALKIVSKHAFSLLLTAFLNHGLANSAAAGSAGAGESVLRIVTGLGAHPWSSLSVRSPNPVFIAAYYLVLFGAVEYAHRIHGRPKCES